MYLVGLTGGIASGKTTASKTFQKLGCPVIDADLVARKVVEPGQPASLKIREQFGDSVFLDDGCLNREALGKIIFDNPDKRKQLNAIVHPAIKKTMLRNVLSCFLQGYRFAILDVPLLFETKQMLPFVSYTIVVHCDENQQLRRLMERNNFSEEEALLRINSQMPMSEKCKLGTFLIDNSKTVEDLEDQVESIHETLMASKKHLYVRFCLLSAFIGFLAVSMMLVKKLLGT